jgi:polyhydroxybutyrate depolymerase
VNIIEWVSLAGCEPQPTEETVSPEVERWVYEGCTSGDVEIYVVEGGGHSWPGNEGMATIDDPVIAAVIGKTTLDISATELAWDFFASHPQSG